MSQGQGWTTPKDVVAELTRLWTRGRLLDGTVSFPLELALRRPDARALGDDFDGARGWVRELEAGSHAVRGYGYALRRGEINHRQLGRNEVPVAAVVPTLDDALRLCGKVRDAQRFHVLRAETVARVPALVSWIDRRPMRLLDEAESWAAALSVVEWFLRCPRPGCYLRQLDIPTVDTKFIEGHRGLLTELLNAALPTAAIEPTATGAGAFERRFGLRTRPALVRFRILDLSQAIAGLTDLTLPTADFARLDPQARRVFITENEVNGLALPETPDSLVIFGLGYTLDRIAEAEWLRTRTLHYWGDLDTHGFAMLSRLRGHFPHARSWLMDRDTLLDHRALWVREDVQHRGDLANLDPAEQALYDDLRFDRLGERVRLEQERIAFGRVEDALADLTCEAVSAAARGPAAG